MKWKFWERDKETRNLEETGNNIFASGIAGLSFANDRNAISLSAVFAAVELISNTIAEIPIYVKAKQEGNKSDIVQNHPIYMALDDNIMTRFMLIKSLVSDMLLYGNGYAYIKRAGDGTPLEIIYLPKGKCQVYYDEKHNQVYYVAQTITNRKIEPINMIHLMKNTKDGFQGVGVIQYAANTIKLSNFAEKAATSFYGSGCSVGGILSTDSPRLTDKQREDIRTSWQMAHSGDNMQGIAVLEHGMKWSPVTQNSKDAQLLESRIFNIQEVARFFNINPTLLGEMSHSSYATLEAAQLEFLLHTLQPIVTLMQYEFTRKLLLPTETSLYIDFEEGYLLKSDKVSQANYLNTLVNSGILSINEARHELGKNPIDGGDEHIIPYTNLDQNNIKNIDKENNEGE